MLAAKTPVNSVDIAPIRRVVHSTPHHTTPHHTTHSFRRFIRRRRSTQKVTGVPTEVVYTSSAVLYTVQTSVVSGGERIETGVFSSEGGGFLTPVG